MRETNNEGEDADTQVGEKNGQSDGVMGDRWFKVCRPSSEEQRGGKGVRGAGKQVEGGDGREAQARRIRGISQVVRAGMIRFGVSEAKCKNDPC